jgi:hypothetical protein
MNTSSDFLWRLIHSLSSSEKLFFKRNYTVTTTGNERLYIKLFNAIALQKNYNEEAIIKKFTPQLTRKNIASQKHYLLQLISDAIVEYDSRSSVGHAIYKQMLLIRVYRKKGLLTEAHSVWKKAVTRARQTESYAVLNLLKAEYEKMILSSSVHISYDEMHSIFKGHLITHTQYAGLITLRDIYAEVLLLKRTAHFDLENTIKEKTLALLQQVETHRSALETKSFWLRHYYHLSKATLLYLLNDIPSSFPLLQQALTEWKKNPSFIETNGEHYIELLYMINYAGILHGSYSYVEDAFNLTINNQLVDKTQRANFEAVKYLALNKVYNKTARYYEVEKLVKSMKTKYRQWEPVLNADLNRTVNFSLGIASFVLEQFDDALYFTKRGALYFKDGTREEQISVGQVLLLLIAYSLNNSRIFDAQYRSTYTYFYKRKKKHPFESALVQCLRRTFYMKDVKAKIEEYKTALEVFMQNKEDHVQQQSFAIFNYPGWLTSKIRRIPYRRYVEEKVKKGSLA